MLYCEDPEDTFQGGKLLNAAAAEYIPPPQALAGSTSPFPTTKATNCYMTCAQDGYVAVGLEQLEGSTLIDEQAQQSDIPAYGR